jgi:hypothetical protein
MGRITELRLKFLAVSVEPYADALRRHDVVRCISFPDNGLIYRTRSLKIGPITRQLPFFFDKKDYRR